MLMTRGAKRRRLAFGCPLCFEEFGYADDLGMECHNGHKVCSQCTHSMESGQYYREHKHDLRRCPVCRDTDLLTWAQREAITRLGAKLREYHLTEDNFDHYAHKKSFDRPGGHPWIEKLSELFIAGRRLENRPRASLTPREYGILRLSRMALDLDWGNLILAHLCFSEDESDFDVEVQEQAGPNGLRMLLYFLGTTHTPQ